ncbi:MAG: RNA polymerase sigma factor [Planctomycetota bacterium]
MVDDASPVEVAERIPPKVNADERLRTLIAARDPAAFEELVRQYQERVTRLARRLLGWSTDVEDVVQEVFVAVLANLDKYRGDASLLTWLTTITVNTCRSHQRRRQITAKIVTFLRWRHSRSLDGDRRPERTEDVTETVRKAVRDLPIRLREAVVLCYFEERSTAEAGKILGISANAVQVRLHRGRELLKTTLRDIGTIHAGSRSNEPRMDR